MSIGVLLSVLLAFLMISEHALGGGWGLTGDGFGVGPLSLLFALACGIGFLKRVGVVRSGLSPQELLMVFSMLLMVPAVSTVGLYLLPHMVGFGYYATQENRWEGRVVPLLPEGLVILDPEVARGFFEGVREGRAIPYGAWAGPLCAWGVLLGTLYFTLISLLVILRKRWMAQERLPFPLAELPLSLAGAGERPLLKDGVFWFGFAIPVLVGGSAIVHRFLPFTPPIQLYFYTRFYRDSIGLLIYAHFLVLGVSYLVSLDILSSILLFTLLSYVQIYLILASGFSYSGLVIGSLTSKLISFGGMIGEPSGGQPIRLLWSGVGAAAVGLLILARQRLFWWPLHPVGFAIGTVCPSQCPGGVADQAERAEVRGGVAVWPDAAFFSGVDRGAGGHHKRRVRRGDAGGPGLRRMKG